LCRLGQNKNTTRKNEKRSLLIDFYRFPPDSQSLHPKKDEKERADCCCRAGQRSRTVSSAGVGIETNKQTDRQTEIQNEQSEQSDRFQRENFGCWHVAAAIRKKRIPPSKFKTNKINHKPSRNIKKTKRN
jgi:hypothetical protein